MNIRQQGDWGAIDVVVRTKLPVETIAPGIRAALRSLDPTLPTGDFQTLGQIVDRAVSPRRFVLLLLGAFTAVALLLASLGIYGVVSYSVNQRTQEIGIRMALGASAANVRWRVLKRTLVLASIGVAIGAMGSFAMARVIGSLLYGVTAADPLTFVAMMVVLAAIALLAGYVPARRASRIDPMSVLRSA
jgi:ABC-type antimicrobial peptide transport system permease subunit